MEQGKDTQVAVAGQFTQADIPGMLEQVTAKIAELTKGKKPENAITKGLPGFGDVTKISDLRTLIQACSSVEGKATAYATAATNNLPAGVKAPQFQIEGHTEKQWLDYLKERIQEVAYQKELKKLREIKKTLEENLSQEAKLANDLKKIKGILGGDDDDTIVEQED